MKYKIKIITPIKFDVLIYREYILRGLTVMILILCNSKIMKIATFSTYNYEMYNYLSGVH